MILHLLTFIIGIVLSVVCFLMALPAILKFGKKN